MELAYWILAGFLAAFYLFAGSTKLRQSKEQLEPMMGWVDAIPMPPGVDRAGRRHRLARDGLVTA